MGRVVVAISRWLIPLLLLGVFVCSAHAMKRIVGHEVTALQEKTLISTTQKDITTPLPTIPLPTIPSADVPTITSSPILNPTRLPDSPGTTSEVPLSTSSSPSLSGASWCIAIQSANQKALQTALDYACGYGGADCSQIQPGRSCYNPNTLQHHASYAFNNYYQKNPIPNSCNFGGTGMITNTNPSSGACQFPSISTSSSVLDTSNQNSSNVFGVVPTGPSTSGTAPVDSLWHVLCALLFLLLLHRYDP